MSKRRTIDLGSKLGYEEARINALTRYRIAGTLPEEIFDHYVQMATLIFRIPAAIIAFVGTDMVHYKASIGVGSAAHSIRYGITCAETIDCGKDIHTVDLAKINSGSAPLNADPEPVYNYYVGTPIVTADGYTIGCLSLLDHKVRKLSDEQHSVLKILASAVMDAVEERLKNLQDRERNQWFSKTTQEGMWEWDIYQDKIWWNSGFSIIFGYPPAILNHYDLNFWCSRFEEHACSNMKEAMHSFILDGEYLFKKADDSLAHVLIRSVIIRDDYGRPVKVIGSMLDISERFKNEELNRKANQDLMRNKDEFISIASHEIKTPITIIKSYSQIIRKEAERNIYDDTNLKIYAERIQKQSDKLLKLVENLLDISRINTGKMIIYPETFDFTKLLEQTLDELDARSGSQIIELTGDAPLRVYADEFRIGQVLTNLITNAIKYSPGTDRIIINCSKNVENNTATISVQDFGKGIAKADQEKLFQKFERIINIHENQVSGTGLGLSIAIEIMKQHGSTIILKSEEGKGSIFSFKLMLSPAFNTHLNI